MIIARKYHFDAAHHLPDYPGDCRRLHGHTWTLTVKIIGIPRLEDGMVLDFKKLNLIVQDILSDLDHHNLDNVITNPTCENLATLIYARLEDRLPDNLRVYQVILQEGEGGWVEYP